MNYIIMDLEWNQCPGGKERENPKLPFEIIEIGAVKLDEAFQYVDEFHQRVKPQVYHQLHYRTKQLLKVNIKDFSKCKRFSTVMREFLKWCGTDYRFATWGSMDLDYLQNNMDFFRMPPLPTPLFYYDVQKLFSLVFEDGKSHKALKYAVEFLNIEEDRPFHCAIDDAAYTAKIMAAMKDSKVFAYYSVDYHRPPASREEELSLVFPDYNKFVSMTYERKEDIMADKVITGTRCQICDRALRKKIRWFTSNNSTYYSLSACPDHGLMQGKIRIKKTDKGEYFAIRTTHMVDEESAGFIKEKQDLLRTKRRIRRSKGNSNVSYKPAAGEINLSQSAQIRERRKKNIKE